MIILGIESSHDDTSIAIIENRKVIYFLKTSQTDIHKRYGGTIPEIASRVHYDNFYLLLEEIKSHFDLSKIDLIAYTKEPGLIGALQMGQIFAHSLSKVLNKPLMPINHLYGHIFSVLLDNEKEIKYPCISLVVSGGHTNMYLLKDKNNMKLIGQTLDDALGEVYDKVARVIYNEFPGGPKIDEVFNLNKNKEHYIYKLNDPKLSNKYDFSFSGYKTQVINLMNNKKDINKDLLATNFQYQVINFLINKVIMAIEEFKTKTIILSGGVSANSYLREKFVSLHKNAMIPDMKYSTDNGAMIAIAAYVNKIKK